jgi:outer membrane lipoprotein carrier protein
MHRSMRRVADTICLVSPLILAAACGQPAASNGSVEAAASAAPVAQPAAPASAAAAATPSAEASASDVPSAAPSAAPKEAPAPPEAPQRAKRASRDNVVAPAPSAEPVPSSQATTVVADAASDLARRLDAIFAGAKTFRARFEQSYTIAAQGVEKRSSGTVIVSRPGKLAFLYDAPNGNRVVSDGKELHVYDAGSQQDIVQPVAKAQLPGAFGFLMGQGVADAFRFRLNPNAKTGEALLLGTPVEATPSYERVQFTIDTAKLEKKDVSALEGVLIVDAQKNKNRFVFSNGTVPEKIGDDQFAFSPPAGTSIKRL